MYEMKPLHSVAFVGNYLPRRCGIATFTYDLHRAVADCRPDLQTTVVAMSDPGRSYDYPPVVQFQLQSDTIGDYAKAAQFLNTSGVDVVSLQHEYGIYGGAAGGHIVELLSRLKAPVVTTLHTMLPEPSPNQRRVMDEVIAASTRLVVMSAKGHELLRSVHGVPARKIDIIAHGIPEFPFVEPHTAKAKLGFSGKTIILTFGLLSPSKGIETVIEAMPMIIEACPNVVYVILGATHPNLVRDSGEAYRKTLMQRAQDLDIQDHIVFVDQFVDQNTLLDFISMCDVYVTPYLNETQMTSGTLAYSFGLGKAVVSTPYWHARELLDDGRGILVPFGDIQGFGREITAILTDKVRQRTMRVRAYAESRPMTWPRSAGHYLASFAAAREYIRPAVGLRPNGAAPIAQLRPVPEIRIGHFRSLCDGTGLLQHAVYSVADRAHGYCIDDNARALLLSGTLARFGMQLPEPLTASFAAFVQHAWNPDTGRFRNFMSYERKWLDDAGSQDSHGRTLWALAECARHDADPSRRSWAAALFNTALPVVETFTAPRAWAFVLLGLDIYCKLGEEDHATDQIRKVLADRLLSLFRATNTDDWTWFEDLLAYDNARLSQALIQTGLTTGTTMYVDVGLQSLRWLMTMQTAPSGYFRPVGSKSFGRIRDASKAFDQQPIEVAATISACLAAARADNTQEWVAHAARAFDWFLGENDLGVMLVEPLTGGCADGLHPDRRNENMGAESALSYLLGLVEIRQHQRTGVATGRSWSLAKTVNGVSTHAVTL